jgi:glycosyltransferase involved in cell wall biosynthesis
MRTALIHDWLITYGGADRALEQIIACLPDADLFSLVDFLSDDNRSFIRNKVVHTSFLQHLPLALKWFRKFFPLLPFAVEQFDLSSYDLVISSSHSVAKGVITSPDQLHICYCYSPMRYAWDLQHQYLESSGLDSGVLGWCARWMLHNGRVWDLRTANGVDEFVAISQFVARRIWKVYRRRASVIYPPVATDVFQVGRKKEDFYLTVSRLVPYKRVDLIVEAFNGMPDKRLVVIGEGSNFGRIRAIAGRNITMMGYQDFDVVHEYLQRARAFVFAAEEDFGISVVEAQACGTPVIAFAKGGVLEIIRDPSLGQPTGMFFREQKAEALIEAVRAFERYPHDFDPVVCRENASRFSVERFRREFLGFCEQAMGRHTTEVGKEADDIMFFDATANI